MKGIIVVPIVLGSVLLLAGGAVFGVALYKGSKNTTIETKEYTSTELGSEFNKFDIDLTIADLEFKTGEQKVVVDETKYDSHTVEVVDGTLKVKGLDNRKWYEHIFNWNWFDRVKVTVYMPAGSYQDLKIEANTGNVVIPADYSFASFDVSVDTGKVTNKANVTEDIKVKSATGDVVMEDVTAKNMEVKTSTGDIKLKNVTLSGDFESSTSTGDANLDNVTCVNYTSKSSTGYVDFKNVNVTNHVDIKNGTGHVKMVDSDAGSLYIKTSTGGVRLQLLSSKICQVKASTGKPSYPTSTIGGLCEVETSTGNINISWAA